MAVGLATYTTIFEVGAVQSLEPAAPLARERGQQISPGVSSSIRTRVLRALLVSSDR
jgi:hypothetical protein